MKNEASQDAFQAATKSSIDDFVAIFNNFKVSLFRFEALPQYIVDDEWPLVEEFASGASQPSQDFWSGWRSFLSNARDSGKTVSRVRVFSEPRSTYEKFEVAWGYYGNIEAGEQICEAPREILVELRELLPIVKDFWVADSERCFLMEYDQIGQFLGFSEVSNEWVSNYLSATELLLQKSRPLT